MMPKAGFEPALLAEADFKSAVSTISPPGLIGTAPVQYQKYQVVQSKGNNYE
ncbi:MAG: hypothetical protein RL169_1788 [Armatimonadota bacterium]|jgi:hypothetical protein